MASAPPAAGTRRLVRSARPHLAVAWRACWASRLVVWVTGLAAIAVWGVSGRRADFDPAGLTRPFGAAGDLLVAPGARWDAAWYLRIAEDGYAEGPTTAFFPLYPALVHAGGLVLGSPLVAAMLLSTACFVAGLAALHRLAELEVGPEAARWAVLAMAFFPGALWFSAAYSEGLFLALSAGAVLAARTDRWAAAGVLGLLAASTRSAGVLLVVPLALLWWGGGARRAADLAWVALVPAGLALFCAFLALQGIPADAPFRAQEVWNREAVGPLQGVADAAVAAYEGVRQLLHGSADRVFFTKAGGDPMAVARHNIMLFAFLLLAVPLLVGAVRRLAPAHWAYAGVALVLPLSTPVAPQPLMSLPRFLAVLYPLFLVLGLWMARARVWQARAVLALFAVGLAAFSGVFSTWHWVA